MLMLMFTKMISKRGIEMIRLRKMLTLPIMLIVDEDAPNIEPIFNIVYFIGCLSLESTWEPCYRQTLPQPPSSSGFFLIFFFNLTKNKKMIKQTKFDIKDNICKF